MTGLDPLHISLMGVSGLISILFSTVTFFIARDFKSRDEKDKQVVQAMTSVQRDLTLHEGRISSVERGLVSAETRIADVADSSERALELANNLKGRLYANGGA